MNTKAISELLEVFQIIGTKVPLWTQAQGSNLSYKDSSSDLMYIKPSGFRLDQILTQDDLVAVDLKQLKNHIGSLLEEPPTAQDEVTYSEGVGVSKVANPRNLRPSMETGFHFALKKSFVMHFHSLVAIGMAEMHEKKTHALAEWLTKNFPGQAIEVVEYGTPGLTLSRYLTSHPEAEILLLKNHGVILCGDSAKGILNKWSAIETKFVQDFLPDKNLFNKSLAQLESEYDRPVELKVVFPDFGVFLKRIMNCLKQDEKTGHYYFAQEMKSKEKDLYEIWLSYCLLSALFPDLSILSEEEVLKICGLPTEQYRLMKNNIK